MSDILDSSMDLIKQQLKNIKNCNHRINPDVGFVASNRERMMNQIDNTVTPDYEKPVYNMNTLWQAIQVVFPGRITYAVVRPVAMFVLVAVIATSGWIASVSATANSLPGDLGYKVKMAMEKTQELVVSVTGSYQEKTQMQLEFAKRRAEEVNKVSKLPDDQNNKGKAAVAIKGLENSLKSAQENLKAAATDAPQKMIEVLQDMNAKNKEINNNLKEAQKQDYTIAVAGVKQLMNETVLSAMEAVVQKKNEGVIEISNKEVKQLVQDQINTLTDSATIISTSSLPMLPVAVTSTTNTLPVSTSTAAAAASTTAQVKVVVQDTAKKVEESAEIVKKDLETVQNLIASDQLLEALQKAKQINNTTAATEQQVSDAKQTVEALTSVVPAPVATSTVVVSTTVK